MAKQKVVGRPFQKGQSGNPTGRPKRKIEETYYATMQANVSQEDWAAIVAKAVTQAKEGSNWARQWLSDNLMGKPVQRIEASGPEGAPIQTEIIIRYAETGDVDAAAAFALAEAGEAGAQEV